ncbi:MAG: glycoside hydrolase family 26 protein [Thermoleophilia bacterium]
MEASRPRRDLEGSTSGPNSAVAAGHQAGITDPATGIGRNAEVFLYYYTMYDHLEVDNNLWPIINGKRILMISWEPWHRDIGDDPACNFNNFMSGAYDLEIRRWARELRDVGAPVMFKPMSEMNGDWACWSGTLNGNTPAGFIEVWKYMRRLFAEEGATNVIWVWGPNRDHTTTDAGHTFDLYFPGDDIVDFIGFAGYNWGTDIAFWQNFEEVFGPSYDVAASRSARPIIASETAAPEAGGSKAQWITDAFAMLPTRFPRIRIVTWFNVQKEADWRVNGSPASLEAFRQAAANLGPADMSTNYDNYCVRPDLQPGAVGETSWASYGDYVARRLTVNYSYTDGGANAYDVAVTGTESSSQVILVSAVPFTVGSIYSGNTRTFALQYQVPAGVAFFSTRQQLAAADFCGNVYSY